MIPWAAFGSSEGSPDRRIELTDYNLYHHVAYGPSQLLRGLDSPMLELAHERQFAVSQLGTDSVGFEAEHTYRVDDALRTLDNFFQAHPSFEIESPTSPFSEEMPDFRNLPHSYESLPPLQIVDLSRPRAFSPPPPPAKRLRVSNSPLALHNLMNPEPESNTNTAIEAEDQPDASPADGTVLDTEFFHIDGSALNFARAFRPIAGSGGIRTHREARLRRPSKSRTVSRGRSALHKPLDPRQAEQGGRFLGLAKPYQRVLG